MELNAQDMPALLDMQLERHDWRLSKLKTLIEHFAILNYRRSPLTRAGWQSDSEFRVFIVGGIRRKTIRNELSGENCLKRTIWSKLSKDYLRSVPNSSNERWKSEISVKERVVQRPKEKNNAQECHRMGCIHRRTPASEGILKHPNTMEFENFQNLRWHIDRFIDFPLEFHHCLRAVEG